MKLKFQKRVYRRELATILRNVCVRTNTPVTSNNELYQISSPLIHMQSSYHAEMVKLDHSTRNSTGLSIFGPRGVPNMKFDNCQVNINVNYGPSAPVNFASSSSLSSVTAESHQTTYDIGMPSA